jgi:hypothetical protein
MRSLSPLIMYRIARASWHNQECEERDVDAHKLLNQNFTSSMVGETACSTLNFSVFLAVR